MEYYVIIRGAAGIGKTTIAKKVAKKIKAKYFSYDKLMKKAKLDTISGGGIPSKSFVKANELIIPLIKQKKRVVLDGCFYRKEQVDHLLTQLKTKGHIFTLKASLAECLSRNQTRKKPMTEENIIQVYDLVSKLKVGISINTIKKSEEQIVLEILKNIK